MTTKVLAVCTGNVCRSPMAQGLLRAGAAAVGLDLKVASAGTWESGVPADAHAVTAMAERGIDIGGHRSHRLAAVDIDHADLVLCMSREHIVDVVAMVPGAFERTFTLKELVARASAAGPRRADQTVAGYIAELGRNRSQDDVLRGGAGMDIADPMGQGRRAFDRTAAELEQLIWAAVDLLAGYQPVG